MRGQEGRKERKKKKERKRKKKRKRKRKRRDLFYLPPPPKRGLERGEKLGIALGPMREQPKQGQWSSDEAKAKPAAREPRAPG